MTQKNISIIIIIALILGGALYFMSSNKTSVPSSQNDGRRVASSTPTQPIGKLKVINFEGKLQEVNVGCFADGECYVVVGGKHITTTLGWRQEVVGSVQGVEGFGDLEKHIGENIEVYAQDKGDGTYTLYGNEGFYVRLK